MARLHIVVPAFFVAFMMIASPASAGEVRSIDISGCALNSSPLFGPEGIVAGPGGDIYVSERNGKIKRVTPDGTVKDFADLNDLPGEREDRISAIGLALDSKGDIYAAALDFHGGSVLKVIGPGKPDAGQVTLYRHGIGMGNFVLIDNEAGLMYVSDCRMFSGGVFRFDMKDESQIGSAANVDQERIGEFGYANGLALGPRKEWLYVAETLRGRVSRINLETMKSEVFVKTGGWADGLLLDAERQMIYVCDNKGGRIVAVDPAGNVKGEARLVGKEDQCAPACIVFRDADTLVLTDLWKASMWDALFGSGTYHSYIYQVPVEEIVK